MKFGGVSEFSLFLSFPSASYTLSPRLFILEPGGDVDSAATARFFCLKEEPDAPLCTHLESVAFTR